MFCGLIYKYNILHAEVWSGVSEIFSLIKQDPESSRALSLDLKWYVIIMCTILDRYTADTS